MLTPSAIGGLLCEDLLHKKTVKNVVCYIARASSSDDGFFSNRNAHAAHLAICG